MGEFSFGELVVIIIIAIIIYGKDLPQAARKLAGLYSKFKRQLSDVKDEIQRQIPSEELKIDLPDPMAPGIDPPQAPNGLTASPGGGQVVLNWNSSVNATSYTIRRSNGPGEPWFVIASYLTDLSYTDSDVSPGKTYHYTLSASNSAGESGESDESIATLEGGDAPQAASAPPAPAAEVSPTTAPPPVNGGAAEAHPPETVGGGSAQASATTP